MAACATILWLAVSPLHEAAAAGHLWRFTRWGQAATHSEPPLLRMWRLQLPGTLVACLLFALIVIRASRVRGFRWSAAQCGGAIVGSSIGLILFAMPPPGLPFWLWAATYYATGVPVAFVLDVMPWLTNETREPIFNALVHLWPIVVTFTLVAASLASGVAIASLAERARVKSGAAEPWRRTDRT